MLSKFYFSFLLTNGILHTTNIEINSSASWVHKITYFVQDMYIHSISIEVSRLSNILSPARDSTANNVLQKHLPVEVGWL